MTNPPDSFSPMFSIDVSADVGNPHQQGEPQTMDDVPGLLQQLVISQHRQIQLLEELLKQSNAAQKQRAVELGQWRKANPKLSKSCRQAVETLSRVQGEFLQNLTDEINDNADSFVDSDFMLNEFVDRFGPRLAHLNGVLQVLTQLGAGVAGTVNSPS